MANTKSTTRARGGRGNDKENYEGTKQSIGDNKKQQKEDAEVKRKYEELNTTVEGLREEIASLEKKQLTEENVRAWLHAAIETQAQAQAVTMPIHPGHSKGGYSGIPQLRDDPRTRLSLEL